METQLEKMHCSACETTAFPLRGPELTKLQRQISPSWKIVENHHLEREYSFADFRGALNFTNRVGEVAEGEGHHPDIDLTYGKVTLRLWTHSIGGLAESDFVLAAKLDRLDKPE